VFARGPDGDGHAPVVSWGAARAPTLRIEAGRRVTVRDGDDLPWFDAHTEAQAAVTLRLPERLAAGVTVEERDGEGAPRRFHGQPHEGTMVLAAADPPTADARGAPELFASLFAQPFGQHALATYWTEKEAEPPPVIGVAQDDVTRMQMLVAQAADADRAHRFTVMSAGIAAGAAVTGDGIWYLTHGPQKTVGVVSVGVGGVVMLTSGLVQGLRLSDGERLQRSLADATRRSPADLIRTMGSSTSSSSRCAATPAPSGCSYACCRRWR
jgi:hypothetical protein